MGHETDEARKLRGMRHDLPERVNSLRLARLGVAALCAALALAFTSPLRAESVADFYRGKTLTIVVGSGSGGGYDLNAREISRYIGRHLPGNPTVIVQNMPGASSIVAANYVYNIAPKDGTVIASVQRPIPFERLFSQPGIRFDVSKIDWLGSSTSEIGVVVAWRSAPQKTVADLFKTPMIVGGSGPATDTELFAHALNHLLGTKFQIVSGYPGQADILLAMERGEIQGVANLSWSDISAVHPDWLDQHKIRILLQLGLKKNHELPDVPLALDLARTPEQRRLFRILLEMKEIGRPYFAAPEVPRERSDALRAAFMATMNDPDYRNDVKRIKETVDPVSGADMQKLIQQLNAEPADIIEKARAAFH